MNEKTSPSYYINETIPEPSIYKTTYYCAKRDKFVTEYKAAQPQQKD